MFPNRFLENQRHEVLNVHQDNQKQDIFIKIAVPDTLSLKKKIKMKKNVVECPSTLIPFLFLLLMVSFHYLSISSWVTCITTLIQMLCKARGNTRGNGRGPSFNFLLLPSRNSFILTQPAVRRSALHLEPTWSSLPFVSVSLAGDWLQVGHWEWFPTTEKYNDLNEVWYDQLGIMQSWIQKRDGTAWKCFLLQFTKALLVKLSCKWAHI